MRAQPSDGASCWLNASRPQGKPPSGNRLRTASVAVHHAASTSGRAGSRSSIGSGRHIRATRTDSAKVKATQGTRPTLPCSHHTSIPKKNSEHTSPAAAAVRGRCPDAAKARPATPTGAIGHQPTGGNAV